MRVLRTFLFAAAPLAMVIALVHPRLFAGAPADSMGLDVAALDRTVEPCADFYQFACGGWRAANPVPADESRWGRLNELEERNQNILRGILEKAAAGGAERNPIEQKLGDYYATCLDEETANRKGAEPIAEDLARIDGLADARGLAALVGSLHARGIPAAFVFGSEQDFRNATEVMAFADQGGLGLPDRDYYLDEDDRSKELRSKYLAHVAKTLVLIGESEADAAAHARAVLALETRLARGSLDKVTRRDPNAIYHKLSREELEQLTPSFAWGEYFAALEAPPISALNVTAPDFFVQLDEAIRTVPIADWKVYLRWHLASSQSPLLSEAFVQADFDFFGRTLRGADAIRPRWKRCIDYVDADLGEALGQPYVEAAFGAEGKRAMLEMVDDLEEALRADIGELEWMTPATREQALAKLAAIRRKIGYPDRWRDYSALTIIRGDLVGNSQRANAFEVRRQLAKIGRPLDRGEWAISPPTVNAGYNPLMNDITFPAGILQPPFFTVDGDRAVNYGAIGAVIGHEITHGFDDSGRQFAGDGNLLDWWTATDAHEFERRASCFVDQYSAYTPIDDVKLNGKLTLGENVADAGGLRIAHRALLARLGEAAARQADASGFTPEQRFFIGWGQIWCENVRPETARLLASTDPHSPGRFRVNGVVSNMPEFHRAFGCRTGQGMVPGKICRVW